MSLTHPARWPIKSPSSWIVHHPGSPLWQVMNLSYTPRRFVPLPPAVLPPPGQPTTDPIMSGEHRAGLLAIGVLWESWIVGGKNRSSGEMFFFFLIFFFKDISIQLMTLHFAIIFCWYIETIPMRCIETYNIQRIQMRHIAWIHIIIPTCIYMSNRLYLEKKGIACGWKLFFSNPPCLWERGRG